MIQRPEYLDTLIRFKEKDLIKEKGTYIVDYVPKNKDGFI